MQNQNPTSGFFAITTGAAHGDDNCRMNPLDIFSLRNSFNTTNSALDIEYNGPHVGIPLSFRQTSWSMPAQCGGNLFANTLLNSGKIASYCSGTITSNKRSFTSFALIAVLMSYKAALIIVSFPRLTVRNNEAPLSVTISPQNGLWGQICRSNISSAWDAGSGGTSLTPWTATGASWQRVMQYCDPNVTSFDAKCTTTSCSRSQGIPITIG